MLEEFQEFEYFHVYSDREAIPCNGLNRKKLCS